MDVCDDDVKVGMSPFIFERLSHDEEDAFAAPPNTRPLNNNSTSATASSSTTGPSSAMIKSIGPLGLQLSIDVLVVVLKLAQHHRLNSVIDAVLVLLAEFAGVLKVCLL